MIPPPIIISFSCSTILWTLFYQCYRGLQRIGYFLAGLENPNLQLNPSPCDASLTASMLSPKKTVHSIGSRKGLKPIQTIPTLANPKQEIKQAIDTKLNFDLLLLG